MPDLRQLFQDELLAHYRKPRRALPLARPAVAAERAHRTCGDRVRIELATDARGALDVAVMTRGCAVATAAGSLLAEWLSGRSPGDAAAGLALFRHAVSGPPDTERDRTLPHQARVLTALRPFPTRHGCALLPIDAATDALGQLLAQQATT
ncbi:MAG: hypothetical protein Kow0062_17150 [Acidobacteriota bacterium]